MPDLSEPSERSQTGVDPDPEAGDSANAGSGVQAAGRGSRGPLVAAAAAVLVLIIAFVLVTRASTDNSPSLGAERPAAASPTTSLLALTDAAGPLGTLPPGTLLEDPSTPPDSFSVVTFPSNTPTAPPNTHPMPLPPFVVLTPNNPNRLAVYNDPSEPNPYTMLPNPVQVSPSNPNAVAPLVLLQRRDAGNGWLEVFLPLRPNGSTGFVRSSDVKVDQTHPYRIEVRLREFNLKVFKNSELIMDEGIAEADSRTPTPTGLYYTNMLLQPPDPNGPFGTYAYGLSGYSDTISSFGGGPGQLGIHGTNQPQLIGQKVSHGCIRLTNENIDRLATMLPLGVPVLIMA